MIPNVFHFVFGLKEQHEPFHLMYYLCLASCLAVNQPDEIHFHYHHEPWGEWWDRIKPALVLRRISPERSIAEFQYDDRHIESFRYAHLADFSRLQILLEEGGFYADIDTLFLRKIPGEWRHREFILGQEKPPESALGHGSLCNAWIASKPGAEFARLWLDGMRHAFDGSWSNHSTLLPYKLWCEHPQLLSVEAESAFYALDWTPQHIHRLFRQHIDLPENAYSLHLWNHLWYSRDRIDFSPFHEALLTVDYVRYANTTYANHARAHLPKDVQASFGRYLKQSVSFAVQFPVLNIRAALASRGLL